MDDNPYARDSKKKAASMKIETPNGNIDVNDTNDEKLAQLHAYYYQLGMKDIASKFYSEIEERKKPKPKLKAAVDEDK